MTRRIAAAATGLALVGAVVTAGTQTAGAADGTTPPSFAGSCQLTGTETFTPPLALTGRPTRAVVHATGRCTGTVVGSDGSRQRVSGAAASYDQNVAAPSGSCVGAALRGTGTITIAGQPLSFSLSEPQLAAVAAMRFTAAGWQANGVAYLTPTPQLLATALRCLGGGVEQIPVTISLLAVAR